MTKWTWAIPTRIRLRGQRATNVAHAFLDGVSLCGHWKLTIASGEAEVVDYSGESGYKEEDHEDRRRCKQCMQRAGTILRGEGRPERRRRAFEPTSASASHR